MSVDKLKESIAEVLPKVDVVIAYKQGFDSLHAVPHFITKPEQVEEVIWNPLCVHNLATYLPTLNKKAAVVVKGCDSRAIVQYMQEELINRENVVIIGIPCTGVIDVNKVLHEINYRPVKEVTFENANILIRTSEGQKKLPLSDLYPDKCKTCQYPTPLVYDHLVGEPIKTDKPPESVDEEVREFEKKSIAERLAYWEKEFDRCIRCYACRNACPMCICRDKCIVESRDPHLMSQKLTLGEKLMFHMIHSLHLTGRCIECGECDRACPMGIPVSKLKKMINLGMKNRYGYIPGINPEDKSPLLVFSLKGENTEEQKP
jgi:ferredoxin